MALRLRLHGALAVGICGRLLGRIAAALRLSRVLKGHGMITLAVKLGGSFVSPRGHLVIFGSFSVSRDRHWLSPCGRLRPSAHIRPAAPLDGRFGNYSAGKDGASLQWRSAQPR